MITSADNPRVKAYARLKKARERSRTGLFLIEGHREVERAMAAGVTIETLIVCPPLLGDAEVTPGAAEDVLTVAEAPMRKIAVREHPPGLIAIARQFDTALDSLRLTAEPLLLIVERVEKPGNLGAMMRTADAAGADALVVTDPATDVFNPNVVRASQGALFTVPLAVGSVSATIDWCRRMGISIVGGYPEATTTLWEATLTGRAAVLVGAEDVGISAAWQGVAAPVRIPMAGAADSLNASVAAAVLLFEARRQRQK